MTERRYSGLFLVVVAIFIACLISANIVAVKLVDVWVFTVPAGVVVFPLSYLFGDVLTEVYGYSSARRVIWLGFAANLLVVICIKVAQVIPPDPAFTAQAAYDRILGFTPRLLLASFVAYLAGEFSNAFVLSRMKLLTKGRFLWTRTIGSTLVGEGIDTLIFVSVAFTGVVPGDVVGRLIIGQWVFKVAYEVVATPLTYAIVTYLKKREGVDVFDRQVRYNPLALSR